MSAIARAGTQAQVQAVLIQSSVERLLREGRARPGPGRLNSELCRTSMYSGRAGLRLTISWVKVHVGIPGNERADALAGSAAEKRSWSKVTSLAFLKLRISEKFRTAKETRHCDPSHHGTLEIPPPPSRKPCLDSARDALARTATRIRTGY